MTFWPAFIFVFVYGACVGSFLNVVVYRLPIGKSLITPPSACPRCDHRLAWYDNIPIFGWLLLRGKCRYCRTPISVQYPLVELATALLFAAVFYSYYAIGWRQGFGDAVPVELLNVGEQMLSRGDVRYTWLPLIVHLTLAASLWAATLIDARLFIIPLKVPWTATVFALIGLPAAAYLFPRTMVWPDGLLQPWFEESPHHGIGPVADVVWTWIALGGAVGVAVTWSLLKLRVLPESFADAHEYCPACGHHWGGSFQGEKCPKCGLSLTDDVTAGEQSGGPSSPAAAKHPGGFAAKPLKTRKHRKNRRWKGKEAASPAAPTPSQASKPHDGGQHETSPHDGPEAWLAYPHPRREMLKECLVLLPIVVGMLLGWALSPAASSAGVAYPYLPFVHVLGGVALGYLVGGGIIWVTRILGTLGFGKEAMGLGDVHLLAAVGAVLGPADAVAAFFIAPFLGLSMVLVMSIVSRLRHQSVKVIPYGPYLAAASFVLMVAHEPVAQVIWRHFGIRM